MKQKSTNEQTKTNKLIDLDNRMVVTGEERGRGRTKRVKGVKVTEGDYYNIVYLKFT